MMIQLDKIYILQPEAKSSSEIWLFYFFIFENMWQYHQNIIIVKRNNKTEIVKMLISFEQFDSGNANFF